MYVYICIYVCIYIYIYIYILITGFGSAEGASGAASDLLKPQMRSTDICIYIYIYIIDGNMYNLPLYTVAQGRSGSYPVSG